jgi:hypothetical protein
MNSLEGKVLIFQPNITLFEVHDHTLGHVCKFFLKRKTYIGSAPEFMIWESLINDL